MPNEQTKNESLNFECPLTTVDYEVDNEKKANFASYVANALSGKEMIKFISFLLFTIDLYCDK